MHECLELCMSWTICMSGITYVYLELYICLELCLSVWSGIQKLSGHLPKPDLVRLSQACSHSDFRGARKNSRTQKPSWEIISDLAHHHLTRLPFPDLQTQATDATLWLTELRAYYRGSFCTKDIFVIDLPHCYSKGIMMISNHFYGSYLFPFWLLSCFHLSNICTGVCP